jgi:hypothetical protein
MVLDDLQILSNRPVWLGDWNGTVESLPRGPSRALLIALKMLKESTDEGVQSWGLNLLANFAVHSQDCCQFITGLGAGEAAARGITLALDRPTFSNHMASSSSLSSSSRSGSGSKQHTPHNNNNHHHNRQKQLPPSLYCHSHLQRECSAAHAAMRGISLFVLQVHYGVAQPWILKFMKGQLLNMPATGIDLTLDLLARHKHFAILQDRGLSLLSKIASKHPSLLFGDSDARDDNAPAARSEFERIHEMMMVPPSSVEEAPSKSDEDTAGAAAAPHLPEEALGSSSNNGGSTGRTEAQRSGDGCRLRRIVDTAMEALYLHVEDARVQRLGICLLHELVRCGGERSRVLVTEAGADTFCQAQLHNIQSQLCEKTSREWFRHTAGMLYLLDNSPWEDTFEHDELSPPDGTSATKLARAKIGPPEEEAPPASSSQQGGGGGGGGGANKRSTRSQAKKTEALTNFNKGSSSSSPSMAMVVMMGNAQQAQQREMVVFRMYSVTKKYRQSKETCFAAVRLFDIALSRLGVEEIPAIEEKSTPDDNSWNLFGSSCLLLSSYCFENEPSLDYRILRGSFTNFNAFISEASIWGTARDIFKKHNCAVPKPIHWDCVKHLILLHLNPPEEDLRTRLILLVAEAFLVGYLPSKAMCVLHLNGPALGSNISPPIRLLR